MILNLRFQSFFNRQPVHAAFWHCALNIKIPRRRTLTFYHLLPLSQIFIRAGRYLWQSSELCFVIHEVFKQRQRPNVTLALLCNFSCLRRIPSVISGGTGFKLSKAIRIRSLPELVHAATRKDFGHFRRVKCWSFGELARRLRGVPGTVLGNDDRDVDAVIFLDLSNSCQW